LGGNHNRIAGEISKKNVVKSEDETIVELHAEGRRGDSCKIGRLVKYTKSIKKNQQASKPLYAKKGTTGPGSAQGRDYHGQGGPNGERVVKARGEGLKIERTASGNRKGQSRIVEG